MKPYILVGITGGIGSGKSVVSRLLRLMGVPVYDCDNRSKRLTVTDPDIRAALIRSVGADVYLPDGTLNRARLAAWLFADDTHRAAVNAIIHPAVQRDLLRWADEQGTTHSVVAFEAAILFESGFQQLADEVLMVYAPREVRLCRAMQRDGATAAQIESRMAAQMDEEQKCALAQSVLLNDDEHPLLPQVEVWLSRMQAPRNL